MAFEERDMSGALSKRDKQTENQPDYSGPCMIGNVPMEVAAWLKADRNGKKFMSLKFSPRRENSRGGGGGSPAQTGADLDDDLPF